jgi:hypothetical protein
MPKRVKIITRKFEGQADHPLQAAAFADVQTKQQMGGRVRVTLLDILGRGEIMAKGKTGPYAVNEPTFRTIEGRLATLGINLKEHLVDNPTTIADLEVHPLTLQGVDFTVKDADAFLCAIRNAKSGTDKAFSEGSTKPSDWKQHWAMTASLLATKGIGFREPWRFFMNDRSTQLLNAQPPRMLNAPEWSNELAANFATANTQDISALHISVAFGKWTECNIHIDETGITMMDMQNSLSLTPNAGQHTVNELLLKTIAAEALSLPTWFTDRFNFHVLGPQVNYQRIGASFDVMKGKTYKLTVTASCGLMQCPDVQFSKMLNLNLMDKVDLLKSLNPTVMFEKRF